MEGLAMATRPRAFLCVLCTVAAASACTRTGFETWEFDAALPLEPTLDAARADRQGTADHAIPVDATSDTGASDARVEDTGLPTTGVRHFNADSDPPFAGGTTIDVAVSAAGVSLAVTPVIAAATAALPYAINSSAASAVGDLIVVSGGIDVFPARVGNCYTDLMTYHPGLGALTDAGDLPVYNQGHGLLLHPDGNLYSLMGCCNSSDAIEEAKVYRRAAASSTAMTHVGSFLEDAYHFASAVMPDSDSNSHLLVAAGGYGSSPLRSAVQTFDPETSSAAILQARLPSARCLLAGAVADGMFYLFGGNTQTDCNLPVGGVTLLLDEILAVSLQPEQVTTLTTRLPTPLAGACAVARSDGKIMLFGGVHYNLNSGAPEATSDVLKFDPLDSTISRYPLTLPAPRAGLACARTAGGPIVLFGGTDVSGSASHDIWLVEPFVAAGAVQSPLLDAGFLQARWTDLTIDADLPDGSAIRTYVKIGDDGAALADSSFPFTEVAAGSPLPDTLPRGRFAKLKIVLESTTGGASPALRSASLAFAPN